MSAKANHFKLGLFILIGTALGIGAILALGAGKIFRQKLIVETYLDQSVQGIEVGSKVKYRGVPVGNVHHIGFTRNHYTTKDAGESPEHSYVMIAIELTSVPFAIKDDATLREHLRREVKEGLRARLTSQGVTGASYIEVDYLDPGRYPPLPIDWEPENPYIPSAPSAFTKIVNSAEAVFAELEKIDFGRIATSVERVLASTEQKIDQLPMDSLSTNALELLAEVRLSNRQVQGLLAQPEIQAIFRDLSGAAASLRRTTESPAITNTVAQLERTLRRVDQLIAGKDGELDTILANLRSLTDNLRELSDNAKRFPAHVLFGEPPKPIRTSP